MKTSGATVHIATGSERKLQVLQVVKNTVCWRSHPEKSWRKYLV